MRLLHLDSSIVGEASVSRRLTAAVVDRLHGEHPDLKIVRRDLAADPIPHLTGAQFAARATGGEDADAALRTALAADEAVLAEFLAADIVVIGVPLYNFTVPSQLKAWIDRILVAGRTFRYGAAGPEGLVGGKRVILAVARGNFYGAGEPGEPYEHGERYLRSVLAFLGVTAPEVIVADGMGRPDRRDASIEAALTGAAALAA